MKKAAFVVGTPDACARKGVFAFTKENKALLSSLADDNNLDATVVIAVSNLGFAGNESGVKMPLVREERPRVLAEISSVDPDICICFGKLAAVTVFGKGNVTLADTARQANEVDGVPCPVYTTDGLARVAAQPGVEKWMHLDVHAAVNGYSGTEWGDYTVLLPGDPAYHLAPDGYDPAPSIIGFDLETYPGVDPWAPGARIRMAQVSAHPGKAVVVQIDPDTGEFPGWLRRLLRDPTVIKAGSNIAFDYKWCVRFGIEVVNMWDTSVAEHVLDETNPKKDLKSLTFKYLPRLGDYSRDHRNLVRERGGWEYVGDDEQYLYAGADAEASVATALGQIKAIHAEGLGPAHGLARDLYPILAKMQERGAAVDMRTNAAMETAFLEHLAELRDKICSVLGPINPSSAQQLADALFREVPGIDLRKKTFVNMWRADDTEDPEADVSTARGVLEREADKHPILADILEYRKWSKLHSTYVKSLREKHVVKHGGVHFVHPSFNQNRVETNRLSSSNPNLQNIPRKPKEGFDEVLNVKRQFCSRFDGGTILEADFSQAELRVAAMLSKDPALIAALISGRDVHTETAATLLGKAYDDITEDERQRCKTLNFLILYGGKANTLARQLGIEKDAAKALIKQYFAAFPKLERYIKRVHAAVQEDLVVESPFGFRRHFRAPPNNNWNQWEGWAVQRQAFNHIIQNTAACITFCAIIKIDRAMRAAGMRTVMFGTVHDSILFDVYPGEEQQLREIVVDGMECPETSRYGVDLTVPMVAELESGETWGSKKKDVTDE